MGPARRVRVRRRLGDLDRQWLLRRPPVLGRHVEPDSAAAACPTSTAARSRSASPSCCATSPVDTGRGRRAPPSSGCLADRLRTGRPSARPPELARRSAPRDCRRHVRRVVSRLGSASSPLPIRMHPPSRAATTRSRRRELDRRIDAARPRPRRPRRRRSATSSPSPSPTPSTGASPTSPAGSWAPCPSRCRPASPPVSWRRSSTSPSRRWSSGSSRARSRVSKGCLSGTGRPPARPPIHFRTPSRRPGRRRRRAARPGLPS